MSVDNKITGIILAGGKSSRMRRDKGFCTFNDKPLIEYAIEALSLITGQILIGANTVDYLQYGFPVIADEVKNIGPIGGIYTCLKASQTPDNIILSCDMPMVTTDLLKYIVSEKENFEIIIPLFNGLPEPLCAYYHKQITDKMFEMINCGEFKIQEVVKKFKVKFLPINAGLPFYSESLFTNINSQNDMDAFIENPDSVK